MVSSDTVSAVAATRPEPLLVAEDVRVDVDGVPACDGLTFRTNGDRVLVLGAPRVLFEATTGLANVLRGGLAVRGLPARQAASSVLVAGAAMEPPLPPRWTIAEYVQWSARLAGMAAGAARSSADVAIAKMLLGPMATTELSRLVKHARRATIVAAALATGAEVIALDDPLGGLPDEAAQSYARVLSDALADRSVLVFAPRIPLSSPLAQMADEAILVTGERALLQGPPTSLAATERRFVVRMSGPVESVLPVLSSRGVTVEVQGAQLVIDLGQSMTTRELVDICDGHSVAVVELVPAFRALT
jgi:ABC-type multidrug transport system ATPase subunit